MSNRDNKIIYMDRNGALKNARKRAKKKTLIHKLKRALGKPVGKKTKIITGVMAAVALSMGSLALYDAHKLGIEADKQLERVDNLLKETNNTKRNEWLESIKYDTTAQPVANEAIEKNENILNQICEEYNQNSEVKISQNDIGLILQENLGDGNVYTTYTEEGNMIYVQNNQKGLEADQSDVQWISGEEIDSIIAVINRKDNTTISGIVQIDDEYNPIEIESLYGAGNKEYTMSENYIELEGKENYDKLKNEWQKIINEQSKDNEGR